MFDTICGIGDLSLISGDTAAPNVTIRGLCKERDFYERLESESVGAGRRGLLVQFPSAVRASSPRWFRPLNFLDERASENSRRQREHSDPHQRDQRS